MYAICNYCGVMAAWSRKTLKHFEIFLRFLERRPLTPKFSKFCYESFHRDTDRRVVFKFCRIWLTGNRWNRAWHNWQKSSPGSPAVANARIAPKICQGQPRQCTQSLKKLQISSKSVHFRRSYSGTREHRQNAPSVKWIEYSAEA